MPPSLGRKRPSKQQPVKPPRCCTAQISLAERACKGKMARARRFLLAVVYSCCEWCRIGVSVPRLLFRRFLTRASEVRRHLLAALRRHFVGDPLAFIEAVQPRRPHRGVGTRGRLAA